MSSRRVRIGVVVAAELPARGGRPLLSFLGVPGCLGSDRSCPMGPLVRRAEQPPS